MEAQKCKWESCGGFHCPTERGPCILAATALANPHLLLSAVLTMVSGSISLPCLTVFMVSDKAGDRRHSSPSHTGLLSSASALTAALCLADS